MHPTPPSVDHLARREDRLAVLSENLALLLHGRDRITLEIGSGHGHYLTAYAAAHPGRFCLGIDIMSARLERSNRKSRRARLPNLAFVHASAADLLHSFPAHVLLEDIIILFPDPWPKRRHHKHRVIQPEFLSALAAKTISGARFCFRTDFPEYFAAVRSILAAERYWKIDTGCAWPYEIPTVFQSRAVTYESLIAIRT